MRMIDADKFESRMRKYAEDCYEAEDAVSAQIFEDVVAELQDAPTVEVERIGTWTFVGGKIGKCSGCGFERSLADLGWSYCPCCGLKMI